MNNIGITKLKKESEIFECSKIMSTSEPWITLKRSYNDSIKILSDNAKDIFVAYLDDEVVGFVIIVMKGAFVGYIQTVAVKPDYRGHGIGTKLIRYAEKIILKASPNIFMCVSSFNKNAQKLYNKLGYEIIGELKDYFIKGQSEILLRKSIAPLNDFN